VKGSKSFDMAREHSELASLKRLSAGEVLVLASRRPECRYT
jgi:hypothetical protein